jgi:Uma2 family endonuclease
VCGLEYLLLFGVPNNKLELSRGRSRCAFPFLKREEAEAHFAVWLETLCRWKGLTARPRVRKGDMWRAEAAGCLLELAPRPIELRIPLDGDAFVAFYKSFWRRDFWGAQPPDRETGWEDVQRHYDVQLNLWSLLSVLCTRHGGHHCGRVDLSLTETSAVSPDQYYFRCSREECLFAEDYFRGVPDLIAEVLSPATREIDRGPRKDLYRRAGVRHLWILDPEVETVELFELDGSAYRLTAAYHSGQAFRPRLFPEEVVKTDDLFNTQWKRNRERFPSPARDPEPVPPWLVPPAQRLGLEYLLLLGHPERRWEIWGNRVPCLLAFGSAEEARVRFGHFLEDVGRWEQSPTPEPSVVEPSVVSAELGRFRLTQRGRHVSLDVTVDARKYRELLQVWTNEDAWDWGEK